MVNRTFSQTRIDDNKYRHKVYIQSPDCPTEGHEARLQQALLLRNLGESPELVHCGTNDIFFQKLVIYHNGKGWVAEAEAIITKTVDKPTFNS